MGTSIRQDGYLRHSAVYLTGLLTLEMMGLGNEVPEPVSSVPFRGQLCRMRRSLDRLNGANHHLRQSLVYLNVLALAQPEAYIGGADKLFKTFMDRFAIWIEKIAAR
jgi:hypothetical protein